MRSDAMHSVIVGRLSKIDADYVLVGQDGALRIALPPGFSAEHLQEGMSVTVVTAWRNGHVVAEQIWRSQEDELRT